MKFRARLNKDAVMTLHSVTTTLERISSTAAMYLTSDAINIALITESGDTPKCFAEFNAAVLFAEYRIESLSNNCILFEIALDHLTRALASGKSAPSSLLKLAKRGSMACLSFEAKDCDTLAIDIVHDIPIRVLRPDDAKYHLPPDVPSPQVALEMPRNNKLMRTVVERMGRISKYVNVSAFQSGKLVFRAEHSTATIKTFYNGLQPIYEGTPLDPQQSSDNKATVKLDVRKFSVVLNYGNVFFDNAVMYFTDNASLTLHILLAPQNAGSVSMYVPVILMEVDEAGDDGNDAYD